MSGGVRRGVLFLVLAAAVVGCSESVEGSGSVAAGVLVPAPSAGPGPGARPQATATARPAPPKRDPVATADRVNVRAGDLPRGWRPIPGSGERGNDSVDWVIVCARDVGVTLGSFSGARTLDFSSTGTVQGSQVGSVTGLFGTDAAAHAFVALFRAPAFGRCLGAEAGRRWSDVLSGTVPAFARRTFRVATAAEAALMDARARLSDGRAIHFQFAPVRTGPIVTVVSTAWLPAADDRVLLRAATNIGHRQRTA